jgi:urease beta subunit
MLLSNLVELVPEVLVQHRLAIAPQPAVRFPPGKELCDSLLEI